MSDLRDDNAVSRSEAARAMGSARTERKRQATQENVAKARQSRWADPEARKRFGEAMKEAWRIRKANKQKETEG